MNLRTQTLIDPLPFELELSYRHLKAELARVDLLFKQAVRRWQITGQDVRDDLRGLYIPDADAWALLTVPFGGDWGDTIKETDHQKEQDQTQFAAIEQTIDNILREGQNQGVKPRLQQLMDVFHLNKAAYDAFLLCAACGLDLRYERLVGYLQNDVTRKLPTTSLVLNLLFPNIVDRYFSTGLFSTESPLLKYGLLRSAGGGQNPLLSRSWLVDEAVLSWLRGQFQPGNDFKMTEVMISKPDFIPVIEQWICRQIDRAIQKKVLVVFNGPDEYTHEMAAHYFCQKIGQSLLKIRLPDDEQIDETTVPMLRAGFRDAGITNSLLLIQGPASLFDSDLFAKLLFQLNDIDIRIVVSCSEPVKHLMGTAPLPVWQIDFPYPNYMQRKQLWNYFLSVRDDVDPTILAGQFVLSESQIQNAVRMADSQSDQEGVELGTEHLFRAARGQTSFKLSEMANRIYPRYEWKDIVLPEDQITLLKEIVASIRQRGKVLDEWQLAGKLAPNRGVAMLFAGPPGTGKTMAAEVIAGELVLDLYKIDLSTIVSKYIGETEKNLERIFSEAQHSNAILFFDEADALFGKRSEVRDSHDRYANIEISYLLQRMEAYDGVTILATNLRSNLDEAFSRRLQFAVDFPFPDEIYRLRIWKALFPATVPLSSDVSFDFFARRFKLAGGNIRNIIIGAAYLAASDGGQVQMQHILHSTRRELQKMGRLVDEREFDTILREGNG